MRPTRSSVVRRMIVASGACSAGVNFSDFNLASICASINASIGVSARAATTENISANTVMEQVRLMGSRLLANVGVGWEDRTKAFGGFNLGIIPRRSTDASEK